MWFEFIFNSVVNETIRKYFVIFFFYLTTHIVNQEGSTIIIIITYVVIFFARLDLLGQRIRLFCTSLLLF
jgi:hypothetical protein